MLATNRATASRGGVNHATIRWLLVVGLLVLRIPFLAGAEIVFMRSPYWVDVTFEIGTYFLTALLILWERDNLSVFHIDKLALVILVLGKPLEFALRSLDLTFRTYSPDNLYVLYLPIAFGLGVALLLARPNLPSLRLSNWLWVLAGAGAGIAIGIVSGVLIKLQIPNQIPANLSLEILIFLPPLQLVYAGIIEEPLFRGFLWGSLRQLGWKDAWIWLTQAALFQFAHLYYWNIAPVSFWIIVPLGGLVMGFLAWRSRSIATSMVYHGFSNAVAQMLAYYSF